MSVSTTARPRAKKPAPPRPATLKGYTRALRKRLKALGVIFPKGGAFRVVDARGRELASHLITAERFSKVVAGAAKLYAREEGKNGKV